MANPLNKTWKLSQLVHCEMGIERGDRLVGAPVVERPVAIEDVCSYITEQDPELVYPVKSYMVGIIYATLINVYYGDDFYEVLNDPMLLMGDDPCFIPYQQDKKNYDMILAYLATQHRWIEGGWCPVTKQYFMAECTLLGITKPTQ